MPRYRSYSVAFKRQIAEEFLSGHETLHGLSRKHDISRNLIRVWITKYEAGQFDEEVPRPRAARRARRRRAGAGRDPRRPRRRPLPAPAAGRRAGAETMSGGSTYVPTAAVREAVRGREAEVLDALGIPWRQGRPHVCCPYPNHDDRNPSWQWNERKRRAYCTCVERGSDSVRPAGSSASSGRATPNASQPARSTTPRD